MWKAVSNSCWRRCSRKFDGLVQTGKYMQEFQMGEPETSLLAEAALQKLSRQHAVREIRSNEQGGARHLPVIALTAYSLPGDRERFLREGFDGYVSKPLQLTDLVSEMKRVLNAYADSP